VNRLAYNGDVAAGRLAVFQGASESFSGIMRDGPRAVPVIERLLEEKKKWDGTAPIPPSQNEICSRPNLHPNQRAAHQLEAIWPSIKQETQRESQLAWSANFKKQSPCSASVRDAEDSPNSTTLTLQRTMNRLSALKWQLLVGIGLAVIAVAIYSVFIPIVYAGPEPKPEKPAVKETLTGAVLYTINCSRCHSERYPTEFTVANWRNIMIHMRVRANLPAAQAREILKYLEEDAGK
jgi:hypothetical protein